jgi:hypothetical protein
VRVALFITCFNDTLFPETGRAIVDLLERLGHEVEVPEEQTCCVQMHWNTGYAQEGLGGALGATDERLSWLLGLTERLELLHLLRRELPRNLAAGHLLALDLLADVVDDLRVRQRTHVSDIGEVRRSQRSPSA